MEARIRNGAPNRRGGGTELCDPLQAQAGIGSRQDGGHNAR